MDEDSEHWTRRHRVGKRVSRACVQCNGAKTRCDNGDPACSRCEAKSLQCIRPPKKAHPTTARAPRRQMLERRLIEMETLLRIPKEASAIRVPGPEKHDLLERKGRRLADYPVLRLTDDCVSELRKGISDGESPSKGLFVPMFAKPEVMLLVECFLDEVNPLITLFDRSSLLAQCEEQFPSHQKTSDPAWWACVNTIAAISLQKKTLNKDFKIVSGFSWGFFKNAFATYQHLLQKEPTILSAKAILLMAMFLSGTTDTKTMVLLLSSVAQMVQMLSLHRRAKNDVIDKAIAEDQRRTFWVAFLLEKTASINSGLPSALGEAAVQVELIQEPSVRDAMIAASGGREWSFFKLRASLTIIDSKIQAQPSYSHLSSEERKMEMIKLQGELEAWRQSVPMGIRPIDGQGQEPTSDTAQIAVVMLHCAFYKSAGVVTRFLDFQHLSFRRPSVEFSRATIRIVQRMEEASYTDLWRFLQYALCAVLTVFTNVLEFPTGPNSTQDITHLGLFVRFLRKIQQQGCDIDRFLLVCNQLERIAQAIAQNYANDGPSTKSKLNPVENTRKELLPLLVESDHMQLAQGLMGNVPMLRAESSRVFSLILKDAADSANGPIFIGPASLNSSTYDFN